MTVFNLRSYDGVYAAFEAHDDGAPSWLYVLGRFSVQPPKTLTLAEAWARPGPWALIVRGDVWDLSAEPMGTAAETLGFPGLAGSQSIALAWQADPGFSAAWWPGPSAAPEYQLIVLQPSGANRQVSAQSPLAFGNVSLNVPAGVAVSLATDSSLHLARTSNQLTLTRTDARISALTYDQADLLTSGAGGVAAGGLATAGVTWRSRLVFLLGQDAAKVPQQAVDMPEIRYWRDIGAAQLQRIRLPLFPAADFSTPDLGLSFALNPALPFDPSATRFDVSAASNACFTAQAALMTREGRSVGFAPRGGVGFHLAPGQVDGKNAVYLAPYGQFTLAAPSTGARGAFPLLPGLSGLEYITAQAGDLLELVAGKPAFGAASSPGADGDPSQPPRLTSTCMTSWMKLAPTGAPSRPYYAQPLASVFYASTDDTALPRATDALVTCLEGAEDAFPLAPYANAFAPNVNPTTPPDAISDFEHVYLSGARGAILGSQQPPQFFIDGEKLTVKGATPRGLLAEIGPTSVAQAALAPTKRTSRRLGDVTATAQGQWRRLYLAKGVESAVTLEPTDAGVVDPVVANALLQPDLFLVYNNWSGHPINTAGELDVGGFSFDWAPLHGDPNPAAMLVVAKFTTKVSLADLMAMPERWRDAATLVGDAAAIAAAQQVFAAAMKTAQDAQAKKLTLFDDFLTRIAGNPAWTGIAVFQAPVDGNAMPPTLQILVAGMRAPLRAHHVAVDVTALDTTGGVPKNLGQSSVAGVIYYDDPGGTSPAGDNGFGFYTQSLKVGIFGSVVTSFNAEVGVAANTLFGRPVELEPQADDPPFPDTFLLNGIYHVIADVPAVSFQVPDPRVFDFPGGESLPGGGFDRILSRFEIDSASVLPQAAGEPDKDGNTTHQAQVTLNGGLFFSSDPFGVGVDLFTYGVAGGAGLSLTNFSLQMSFVLDKNGQRLAPPVLSVDYSRLAVAETPAAVRPDGLAAGLPLKLRGILADDNGLDVEKLGGKPVNVLQIAGRETRTPHYALQFELIIGSLGELSSVHAGLSAEMRLAWGPRDTTPDADGALLSVQLPGASGGFAGLNVQGMLQLVFGDANLMQVAYDGKSGGQPANVFVVLFNNVALSVMGIRLPPKVISDLILFSDPRNAADSSLAACLAVRQQ